VLDSVLAELDRRHEGFGSSHWVRGGNYQSLPFQARRAARNYADRDSRHAYHGVRPVRPIWP